ncbi:MULTISPECIES: hypothetical protein [Sphingobium]|nr:MULTISPECIES: hypothetical protein [Sphingobium]BAK64914.1 hypothetical protein SLG_02390 [Sphingobium sp. SYK-6]
MLLLSAIALSTSPAPSAFADADVIAAEEKLPRDHPQAIRCKRLSVTGSLARRERICKTNAEWLAIREQQQDDARDLVVRSRAGIDCGAPGGAGC